MPEEKIRITRCIDEDIAKILDGKKNIWKWLSDWLIYMPNVFFCSWWHRPIRYKKIWAVIICCYCEKTIIKQLWPSSDIQICQCFIFSLENVNHWMKMDMSITFSMEIWHYMVFVSNWKPSCLPHFDKFATTLSITIFCLSEFFFYWVEYNNVVLHFLAIFVGFHLPT